MSAVARSPRSVQSSVRFLMAGGMSEREALAHIAASMGLESTSQGWRAQELERLRFLAWRLWTFGLKP